MKFGKYMYSLLILMQQFNFSFNSKNLSVTIDTKNRQYVDEKQRQVIPSTLMSYESSYIGR